MSNRSALTQTIIDQLPIDQQLSLDVAIRSWWMNLRNTGGMRLTSAGYKVFNDLDLEQYSFDIPLLLPKHLIALDQNLSCPYYIKGGKKPLLILFGSRESIMMALYGDINRFVDMLLRK